ncbi:MAG: ABC transporter permease subunit [Ignavibacteria bacterium]|jgi:Cu-processing system permease protein|nr:ABC transporter permease subunit [Ignavibacteria bacterium]
MSLKILKYVFFDLMRSRFVLTYIGILAFISFGVSYFSNDEMKTVLTLLNIVLFIIPLVSLIFGSIHFYDSGEFTEFLLTQPVSRSSVFRAEYLGLSLALSLAVVAGLLPSVIIDRLSVGNAYLLGISVILTFVFTGLAYLASSMNVEKVRGIGLSIVIWLFMAVIFDIIVILLIYLFRDYPLEKFIIILTSLNPIDLGRILLLLKTDVSALMGFTGASFKNFFGSSIGMLLSIAALFLWVLIPYLLAIRIFRRRNF